MRNAMRILAVAVGPEKNVLIDAMSRARLGEVRPYIKGLVDGLEELNRQLGCDFNIDYRERPQTFLEKPETAKSAFDPDPNLIFAMSTTVLRAGLDASTSVPIVYASVSDLIEDKITLRRNAAGVNAKRTQSAGECLARFVATVPTLRTVHYLFKKDYGPGERALDLVKQAAATLKVDIHEVAVSSHQDIAENLLRLAGRALVDSAQAGVLVGPVDTCLSAVPVIIEIAQRVENLPVFLPVGDWVRPELPSALGAFGVSQHTCGRLAARHVDSMLWPVGGSPVGEVTTASASDFEWVVSSAAANSLNIKVPRVI